jgi:hypothetical protein
MRQYADIFHETCTAHRPIFNDSTCSTKDEQYHKHLCFGRELITYCNLFHHFHQNNPDVRHSVYKH